MCRLHNPPDPGSRRWEEEDNSAMGRYSLRHLLMCMKAVDISPGNDVNIRALLNTLLPPPCNFVHLFRIELGPHALECGGLTAQLSGTTSTQTNKPLFSNLSIRLMICKDSLHRGFPAARRAMPVAPRHGLPGYAGYVRI